MPLGADSRGRPESQKLLESEEPQAALMLPAWAGLAILVIFVLLIALGLSGCQNGGQRGLYDSPSGSVAAQTQRFLDQAKKLIETGNFEAALGKLDQALNASPNDPELHTTLGWVDLYNHEPNKAAAELKKAVTIDPDSPSTLYLAGGIYDYLGQYQKALDSYLQALSGPTIKDGKLKARLLFDTAMVLHHMNRDQEALGYLNQGLAFIRANKRLFETAEQPASHSADPAAVSAGSEQPEQNALQIPGQPAHMPDASVSEPVQRSSETNYLFTICSIQYGLKQYPLALKSCQEAMDASHDPAEQSRIEDFTQTLRLIEGISD